MKKLLLPFIFFITLSLFGCQASTNGLTFAGEGDKWSAELNVNQNEDIETYQIQLVYIADNLEGIETFRYNIKSNNGVIDYSEENAKLNEEAIFENKLLGENSASTSAKDELVIEIEWNGKSESFDLRNK